MRIPIAWHLTKFVDANSSARKKYAAIPRLGGKEEISVPMLFWGAYLW